ncbi:hypothetical protein VZ95_12880 [Elstera litoralis]|uniref:EAL domain-containing protein n=1 Tax=Elstera litoralis TaxID=552518 RepID=A0A0F3IUE8_9PROT|nr:hypothetical protein [Elstera litoralis]KJV09219.1 hypothetical protein VZ95_12880 [Elstera litoralis]
MTQDKKPGFLKRLADALFEEEPEQNPTQRPKPAAQRSVAEQTVGDPAPGLDPAFDNDEAAQISARLAAVQDEDGRVAVKRAAVDWDFDEDFGALAVAEKATDMAVSQVVFAAKLQEVIEKGDKGSAGKLQLLNLDEIKREAGDRWEQMAEKAQSIAEQVIRHRLAPSDVVAPYDDHSFIVLFAELTEEQARLKAAAIAREVRERLLGELGVKDHGWVKAFVTDIETLQNASAGATPDEAVLSWNKVFEAEEDCAPPLPGPQTIDADLQSRLGEVGISYRPTLMTTKGVIGIYAPHLLRLDALNRILMGAAAFPHNDAAVTFEMDKAAAKRAVDQVRIALKAGQRTGLLHITLHTSSLVTHSSGLIIDMFRALPPEFRRFFIIGINTQTPGVPQTKLWEALPAIQPFCRSVTVQVTTEFSDFDRLARAKVSAVGIDLEEPDIGEITPTSLTRAILPLAKHATKAGLHSYLYGIKRREIARAAKDAGFTYLNGPAIAANTAQPIIA